MIASPSVRPHSSPASSALLDRGHGRPLDCLQRPVRAVLVGDDELALAWPVARRRRAGPGGAHRNPLCEDIDLLARQFLVLGHLEVLVAVPDGLDEQALL